MRVGFDLSSMRGQPTGIGIYTANLTAALEARGTIEVVPLCEDASASERTPLRIWREQMVLPRRAIKERIDLLHLTGFAAPLRCPVPVVLTVHDLIGVHFRKDFPPVARFYWSRYLPSTIHSARAILVPSQHTAFDLTRRLALPPERIHVVPSGVNREFQPVIKAEEREAARMWLRLPERYFLFVSTLEPRKGVDVLISAFAKIAGEVAEDLVICGKCGWSCARYVEMAHASGLQKRIVFAGYVPANLMPAVYSMASALVFPSRYEGFGLPALEAMACGTPVISSNAAALQEVVGNAGLVLDPSDVNGFASAMLKVARDKTLAAQLRQLGFERAARFTWEQTAALTEQVYQATLTD